MICVSNMYIYIYERDTSSVVIVGGTHVDMSWVLKLLVKCTHSSQRRLFHNFFDMFKRNTKFLGCRRVNLGSQHTYNWDNVIARFFSNMLLC